MLNNIVRVLYSQSASGMERVYSLVGNLRFVHIVMSTLESKYSADYINLRITHCNMSEA